MQIITNDILMEDTDLVVRAESNLIINEDNIRNFLKQKFDLYNFSFDQAPEGTRAWAMDADGSAYWYSTKNLKVNCRYDDWDYDHFSGTKKPERINLGEAPTFGFDVDNWANSMVYKDSEEFTVTIQVSAK